jgi:hypothetical protein
MPVEYRIAIEAPVTGARTSRLMRVCSSAPLNSSHAM